MYFSGYGIQVGHRNYLIPVDARIWSEADVSRDGIALDPLLDDLAKRRAGIRVTVLDAARRNPFERRFRSFSQGLAPATAQAGTLTLSAAAAGAVINEGGGPKSPFVTELLQQIGTDQTADQAFAATRDALAKRSRGSQQPALSIDLDETFSFDPDRPRTPMGKAAAVTDDTALRAKETRDREARGERGPGSGRRGRPRPATGRRAPGRRGNEKPGTGRLATGRRRIARRGPASVPLPWRPSRRPRGTTSPRGPRARGRRFRTSSIATPPARARTERGARWPASRPTGARRRPITTRPRRRAPRPATASSSTVMGAGRSRRRRAPNWSASPSLQGRKADQERQRLAELDGRIARNPRDEEAFYERGQFHAQRGDSSAAIADFDRAIRLNPASPEAFNNRCWMRAMADDLKMALTDCNEALKLRPGFLDAFDSRGLVNLKAGSLRAAISDYGEALKLDPRHSSALYGRGLARKRLGDDSQAGRDMASALEINPQIDKEFASYGLR